MENTHNKDATQIKRINASSIIKKLKGYHEKVVIDGIYLISPDGSEHYFNTTASIIWNMIVDEVEIASILKELSYRYPACRVDSIEKHLFSLVNKLYKYRLIAIDGKTVPHSDLESIDYNKDRGKYVKMLFDFAKTSIQKCIPVKMVLEVTNCCNINCQYCYASAEKSSKEILTTKEIHSVLKQASELGVFHLTITGGEPFLRHDLFDILSFGMNIGMITRIQTNGTLITEEDALKLSKLNSIALEITLLGSTAKTHDMFVGSKGSFDKSCKSIDNLRNLGIPVTVKFVINKYNISEVESIVSLVERLGVEKINRTALIYPRFNGDTDTINLRVSDDDLRFLAQKGNYIPHPDPCGAGKNKFTVSPFGDVYACQFIRHSTGNIRKQDLKNIWKSTEMERSRTEKWFQPPPVCLSCQVKDTCPRCPAIAYHEDGDIRSASKEACRIAHIVAI